MGVRDVLRKSKAADGRIFAPTFLYKTIKEVGQYRVRLYSNPQAAQDEGAQCKIVSWFWPVKGTKGIKRKLDDGTPEALKRAADAEAVRATGDNEAANQISSTPEYWFNAVETKIPTMMRVLDIHSEAQYKKLALAVAAEGGWKGTEYEDCDEFEDAFNNGWERVSGPNGKDIIITNKATKFWADKYAFRVTDKDNAVLPLGAESGLNLWAVALDEDGGNAAF